MRLQQTLNEFAALAKRADREKLQRLIRLMVQKIEWTPEGDQVVEFYHIPKARLDPLWIKPRFTVRK